jgi:hypothetical protein
MVRIVFEDMFYVLTRLRLQQEALKKGIEFKRTTVSDINDVVGDFPSMKAIFNCTGLGSYSLKGVEDKLLYPTRVSTPTNLASFGLNRDRVKSCS